jgi:hypothetical protein
LRPAVLAAAVAGSWAVSSVTDLLARTGELDRAIQQRYLGERLAREFHERHLNATRLVDGPD